MNEYKKIFLSFIYSVLLLFVGFGFGILYNRKSNAELKTEFKQCKERARTLEKRLIDAENSCTELAGTITTSEERNNRLAEGLDGIGEIIKAVEKQKLEQ